MLMLCAVEFLTYGQTALGSTVNKQPPTVGSPEISTIGCQVPTNGLPATCTGGNQHALADTTSLANTKTFSFTQSIGIEVRLSLDFLTNVALALSCQPHKQLLMTNAINANIEPPPGLQFVMSALIHCQSLFKRSPSHLAVACE